jgi:signal transduction histidine kinase
MGEIDKGGSPDREKTDKQLKSERRNVDRALEQQRIATEAEADQVIDRAREAADAVLSSAREKADEKLETVRPTSEVRAVIAEERRAEDKVVERERATADESLLHEREQNAEDLLALLPLERVSTDRSLLTERQSSDAAVSHRDDFLGIVSHDMRDLLGGIVTTSVMLLRTATDGSTGAPQRDGARRIQRYAARMKRLLDDLTDVVSIDAGKLSVTPTPGDLGPVISEAVHALRAAAVERHITLEFTPPAARISAVFDGMRILQVVTNLIANSLKFTDAGGRISVACQQVDDTALVTVTDSGRGIDPSLVEVIFERFRQAPDTNRRGLGLGLYISRCLIEAQQGRIWAESTPGTGTTVSFALPAAVEVLDVKPA